MNSVSHSFVCYKQTTERESELFLLLEFVLYFLFCVEEKLWQINYENPIIFMIWSGSEIKKTYEIFKQIFSMHKNAENCLKGWSGDDVELWETL